MSTRLARFMALPGTDKAKLLEAAVAVVVARVLVAHSDLRHLSASTHWLGRWPFPIRGADGDPAPRLRWALTTIGPRVGATCLPQSLALHWLLARRGIRASVCIGVGAQGALFPAHAWVEIDGRPEPPDAGAGYERICV